MKRRLITAFLAIALLLTLAPMGAVRVSAASDMKVSDECVEIIKKWEGFSAKPYWDYQQWTVGYGTRVPDGKLEEYQKNGISKEEATALLHSMIDEMCNDLRNFIDKFDLKMTQGQFDALLSLTFNCGPNWMWQPSTFRTAVIEGWKGNDFLFAMGQWSTAGGVTVPALIRRRLAEACMYLDGKYDYAPPADYAYVRFDANGGTTEIITQCYDLDTPAQIRAVPEYPGYNFEGWYTDPTGGEKVETLDSGVRNYMLYAHWSAGDGADLPQDSTQGDITGTPVNYQRQIATGYLHSFDAPVKGALVVNAYHLDDIVDICEEYTDSNGMKWGKIKNGGWINLGYTQEPKNDVVEGPEVKITVTATDVNIRRGPGTGYALVGKADKGDQMVITQTATGSGYTWGRFSEGWICLQYTNYDSVVNGDDTDQDNAGDENTGNENTGNENTGNENTGNDNTGNDNTGNDNTGSGNTGNDSKPELPQMGTVVVNDGLRIRAEAGTDKPVLGFLSNNTRVRILEKKTVSGMIWGRIDQGWISLDYVKLDKVDEDTNNGSGETDQEQTKPEAQKITGTVVLSSDRLNVRTGPSTGYPVVGSLGNGDKVEILEQKTVGTTPWGRTEKGWICLDYVKLDEADAPADPELPDNDTNADTGNGGNDDTNTDTGNGGNDDTNTDSGNGGNDDTNTDTDNGGNDDTNTDTGNGGDDDTNTDTDNGDDDNTNDSGKDEQSAVTGVVVLSSERLNIRKGPGTDNEVVGSLASGTRVTITEQKKIGNMTWGKIAQGWISMDYVRLDSQKEEEVKKIGGTVSAGGTSLHIRTGPGTTYAIAGYLADGSRVEILERKTVNGTEWGRITKGWICLSYVVIDGEESPKDETAQNKTGVVIADCLRIRSGAGLNNSIVGALYTGEKVTILETKVVEGMTWGRIEKGWISMDYIK